MQFSRHLFIVCLNKMSSGFGCCVPGCSSGKEGHSKVTMYAFPRGNDERKKWINAIGIRSKSNFNVTKAKVCSLHFMPKDLIKVHRVALPMLRQGAVPKVFLDGQTKEEKLEAVRRRNQGKMTDHEGDKEVPYCAFNGCQNDVMDLAKGVAFFK